MKHVSYDIVIVGGGLVGASMALALAGIAQRYQLSIAIIDAAKAEDSTPTAAGDLDGRATALALGSRNLLDSIGVWADLCSQAQPIMDIDVSDQGQPFGAQMQAQEMDQQALGYVLQNQHMGQVFWQQLTQRCVAQVSIIDQAQVLQVDNARQDSKLVYERTVGGQVEKTEVICQLVIMADGGRSSLRDSLGMYNHQQSYDQVAVVVNVALDKAHHGLACERFTSKGPMAVLPLLPAATSASSHDYHPHRAAIVWTQPKQRQAELSTMDNATLLTELQNQIGFRMGQFRALGERQVYPLSLSVAKEQARQGLAVIGNAAHTLHPIAGQGFNLALRGAFALAEQVHMACKNQAAIGDLAYLQKFVEASRGDQKRTVGASDQVMKLFSSRDKSLTIGRQLGLLAMQNIPLAKTVFTRSAMGLDRPLANVLPVPVAEQQVDAGKVS
ncbi:MAG TPA: 2-octaprenyl-6-methoxyphenyl hydroxylase [Oceanospirillaceae bacterium]|nr:2-octaprenyl-6-methoxyphenyl hydroxylase [Oceanospirillaceae bacterium]